MNTLRRDPEKTGGIRDRHNVERRQRIREAAREVFCKRGYLDATIREICERAGVGNGTLFRHAADKRELLLLIVNDDLDYLHIKAVTNVTSSRRKADIRDKVLSFYRVRYDYFARYPQISRPFASEVFNLMAAKDGGMGPEARRHRERRQEVIDELAKLIGGDPAFGEHSEKQASLVANVIHAIYLSASRQWLENKKLDPSAGLRWFAQLFDTAMYGLGNM